MDRAVVVARGRLGAADKDGVMTACSGIAGTETSSGTGLSEWWRTAVVVCARWARGGLETGEAVDTCGLAAGRISPSPAPMMGGGDCVACRVWSRMKGIDPAGFAPAVSSSDTWEFIVDVSTASASSSCATAQARREQLASNRGTPASQFCSHHAQHKSKSVKIPAITHIYIYTWRS